MPVATTIMNAKTGTVVATIQGLGGSDMVNYNAKNNRYYTASRDNPSGPVLGVVDAANNTLVQTIPITGGTPHSTTECPCCAEAIHHIYDFDACAARPYFPYWMSYGGRTKAAESFMS